MGPYPYPRAAWYVVVARILAIVVYLSLIVGAVVMLAGCSPAPGEKRAEGIPYLIYSIDGTYFAVAEFHLTDGTRCVAVGGNTGRGITCEWKDSPNNVEKTNAED